jgi:hypothetical protein
MRSAASIADSPVEVFPPARRRFALWVIYGVLGIHVVAMMAKIDEWPLSYYPMYSRVQPPEVCWDVVYGVTADGREVRLQDDDFWQPIGASRLGYALKRLRQETNSRDPAHAGDGQPVDRTIAGLMTIYESRRGIDHDGPPLAKLRLYSVTWRLDPRLANLDSPNRRELVCEYVAQR